MSVVTEETPWSPPLRVKDTLVSAPGGVVFPVGGTFGPLRTIVGVAAHGTHASLHLSVPRGWAGARVRLWTTNGGVRSLQGTALVNNVTMYEYLDALGIAARFSGCILSFANVAFELVEATVENDVIPPATHAGDLAGGELCLQTWAVRA